MIKYSKLSRRFITTGPNREELFDSLRLGFRVNRLGVVFLERFYKNQPFRNVAILGIERVYDNDLWVIRFNGDGRTYEGFYSTRTRTGYVCDTRKIYIWPNGTIYRPLTDHQLTCLLYLADIADNEKFSKHILARIIQAMKGIQKFHGYDVSEYKGEPNEILDKINALKKIFHRNILNMRKDEKTILSFKEILG